MGVASDFALRERLGGPAIDLRADERAVRLLFVEHDSDYGDLVRATLDSATRGRFDVENAQRLDAAAARIGNGSYDALLLDFTGIEGDERGAIEAAADLACRVPVIVLTGSEKAPEAGPPEDPAGVRERLARSRLPDAILRAVRRYRRLGQQGAEPIVLRDPLRAFAHAFARLRSSLAR